MFDFAWSEIALIAAVALVVIGPKDLPVAIRAITGFMKKARRMAGEFQTHVDEMMRDADMKDVRDSFREIRNFDIRSTVEKAIDPDRSLRNTFSEVSSYTQSGIPTQSGAPAGDTDTAAVAALPESEAAADEHAVQAEQLPMRIAAPAYIPPAFVPFVDPPPEPPPPPAFIPPIAMLQRPPN
jgi:sec-independent protein translocase protein TatB